MRPLACLLFLLCCSAGMYAQSNAKITGKVIDSVSHKPVEYATITVTDKLTRQIINGAITDSTGAFEVNKLPAGNYLVAVEFISYSRKSIDNVVLASGKDRLSLNTILLNPSGKLLKEVSVTGSMPIIENKIDKLVYNAANDITSQGGAAIDVLKKVPMVSVDIDGNVELQGNSNIRFLINGKPSSIFGSSLADALATIPASQIKSIEVITSPGSKYDAQGTGGIINIILKDNKMQGYNGNINLSAGTRFSNGSANLNLRRNKLGINAYISGNTQVLTRTPSSQNRASYDAAENVTSRLLQNGYSDFKRSGNYAGLGFDYSPTKHDNFSGGFTDSYFGNYSEGTSTLSQTVAPAIQPVNSTRISNNRYHNNSFDANLRYKKTFKKEGQELEVLGIYSTGSPTGAYTQSQRYDTATLPYKGTTGANPGSNYETNISIDYNQPVTANFSFETGAKAIVQNITSISDVSVLNPALNTYLHDPGQSYRLNYNRQVYAAYFSTNFSLHDYLKVKLGGRFEHTDTKIDFPNTSVPQYNTLVPSLILSHDIDKSTFVKFAYSRRIERPEYWDLNPSLNLADPYNISTGNPTLLPEYGNNMEVGFNKGFDKKGNFYIALIERINTQDHKPFTTFYPTFKIGDSVYTNVSITMPANTGTEYNSGINISGSYTIKEKLTFRGNFFLMDRYLATNTSLGNFNAGLRLRSNLNISHLFPHDLVAEVFGNYNSATTLIQGRSPQSFSYSMAFRKQFWDKKASIGVTASNIFNEYSHQVNTIVTQSYNSYSIREVPIRSAAISFTYKFGKLEFKKSKDDDNFQGDSGIGG
jgi:ferric enterobactin receptor